MTLGAVFQSGVGIATAGTLVDTVIHRLSGTGAEAARQDSSAVVLVAVYVITLWWWWSGRRNTRLQCTCGYT